MDRVDNKNQNGKQFVYSLEKQGYEVKGFHRYNNSDLETNNTDMKRSLWLASTSKSNSHNNNSSSGTVKKRIESWF